MTNRQKESQNKEEGYQVDRKVISGLIKKALNEVEGIYAVKRGLWGGRIRIKFLEEGIGISLELIIKEGNAIPQLVEETQKKVKQEVEKVLDKPVTKVNIKIKGIKHIS